MEGNVVHEEINLVDEEEEEEDEAQQAGEAIPANQAAAFEPARPQSSSRPQPLPRQPARQERLPSYRRQQPPMTPSFHAV